MTRIFTRTAVLAAVVALFTTTGCGNGGSVNTIHTTGTYGPSTLNGTYIYEIHGDPFSGFYREIGAFTADGAGNITAGSDDSSLNSGGLPVTFTGSYQVFGDGTGFITFNNTALGGGITLAITIVSSSQIELMEADVFDATGEANLQTSTTAPSGTYVFRLHSEAAAQSTNASSSEVGAVTVSSGSVTGGAMDQNLGGTSSQLSITGGSFSGPGNFGRGTGTITDSSPFSTTLIYYVVSNTKVALLVSNSGAIGAGDAELQSGAFGNGLSGNYAFGSTGDDRIAPGATATVGSFTATGGAINPYTFDSQQDGNSSKGSDTGTYTFSANGRVAVTLTSESPEVFWMVSPSRAFFLISDPNKVEDGAADQQTVNSFSASTMSGQYALVMGGVDLNFGQDLTRIGPMNFNGSGKLTLAELINASGSGQGAQPPPGGGLSGSYQVDSSTGRITGTLSNSGGGLDLVMYAVSGSNAYVLQPDSGFVTSGTVNLQH